MPELTRKAIFNCVNEPECSECQKYTLSYLERFNWKCDNTCKIYEELHKDPRFPEGYAEIDYGDRDDPEAIEGSRFDDLNFMRYFER